MGSRERIEREKEKRRGEILRAAEKLFLKKGLNSASMEEIARECELSKGTLYLYFANKEQLFHSIVHRAMSAMYDLMMEMQEGVASPVERLRMIGEAYFRFYADHPDHFRFLSRATEYDHPDDEKDGEIIKIKEKHAEVWTLMTGIIRDGMRDGTFRKDTDPLEIALSLYAISTMILQLMDQYDRHRAHLEDGEEMPFGNLDFPTILRNNGRRIVMSIMTHPPANPE